MNSIAEAKQRIRDAKEECDNNRIVIEGLQKVVNSLSACVSQLSNELRHTSSQIRQVRTGEIAVEIEKKSGKLFEDFCAMFACEDVQPFMNGVPDVLKFIACIGKDLKGRGQQLFDEAVA